MTSQAQPPMESVRTALRGRWIPGIDPPDFSSEHWRPVIGYEGCYEVSDHGRVRSLKSGKFRHGNILRTRDKNGYCTVTLSGAERPRTRLVHQLVLEAFIGLREPGMMTRHLNSIRDDNRLENLTWGTHAENMIDLRVSGNGRRTEMWNR